MWQNWSLSPASGTDPKQSTAGRAVSSFLVSTKGRLNLQVIPERDMQRECFVPTAETHLQPALSHLQHYLHPTTHCNIYVLVGGPQSFCHFTVAVGMHGTMCTQEKWALGKVLSCPMLLCHQGLVFVRGGPSIQNSLFSRETSFYLQSVGKNVGLKEGHCRHWGCHSPLQELPKSQ